MDSPENAAVAVRTGGRLDHLDGLRAVASLYVVLFHAAIGFPRGELEGPWRLMRRLLSFGHEAVAVFIVLSGYCLMLPVVRRGGDRLPRSVGNFIARRAFRILPPYYVTILLSLALIATVPVLARGGSGTIWDDSLPGLALAPILSHAVVLHNWFPELAFQINGPLWSVATEWQIYFFFPWLLLPLWRRFGLVTAFLVAAVIGYLPLAIVTARASAAIPWYLALFALGMAAAAVVHSSRGFEAALRVRVPWRYLTGGLWACSAVGGLAFGSIWFQVKPLTDLLLGFATASFLVYAALTLEASKSTRLLALLGSKAAVGLGHFSYSLYLTHLPVLALVHFALDGLALSPHLHALGLLAIGTPASVAFAWLFYWAVERHCIGQPPSLAALTRLLRPRAARAQEGVVRK